MLGDHDSRESDARPPVAFGGRPGGAVMERGRYPSYEWYGDDVGEEPGLDFQNYFRILVRHWLVIVISLVVALAAGVVITVMTTPIYTARATIQIDREAAKVGPVRADDQRGGVGGGEEFYQTQYSLLKSRSLAEATAKDPSLDLAHDAAVLKTVGLEGSKASVAQIQDQIAGYIQRTLRVEPLPRSRLVTLSFDSPNAAVSARLVNGVANNFIQSTLDRRLKSSSYARDFLARNLAIEKDKLQNAERQLAEYAKNQQIISISAAPAAGEKGAASGGSSAANTTLAASSLSAMVGALNNATAARIAAESKLRSAQASGNRDSTEILQSTAVQTLKAARAKLEAEYQDAKEIYREDYPAMVQRRARINDLDQQINAESQSIRSSQTGSLEAAYRAAVSNEQQLKEQVRALTGNVLGLRERSVQYDILQREVETSRELYENLLQNYKEVGVAGNLTTNNIQIIDAARVPGGPSRPQPMKNLAIALVIGLALGVSLAFLIEFFDQSIRSPEDVENKLGLPLLGAIPKLEKGVSPSEAMADVRSAFSEAYYSVRTALQFSTNEGVPSSLVVTSARPSEGKSTSSTAIAQNFARLGSRVLLIDSDLRNPSLHRVFKAENNAGFSNYLTGGTALANLAQVTQTPGLFFIPCGPLPPNPAELLGGERLKAMLDEARANFDIVIIDAPPVMGLADAPLLASAAAGVILVVESGATGRKLAKASIRRLTVGHARTLGVVLSKFDSRSGSYGYGYGYNYDYGPRAQIKG